MANSSPFDLYPDIANHIIISNVFVNLNLDDSLHRLIRRAITHQQIKLNLYSTDQLYKYLFDHMGYAKSSVVRHKATNRLTEAINSPLIGLDTANYDFKFSNSEFVIALCKALDIPMKEYSWRLIQLEDVAYRIVQAKFSFLPNVSANLSHANDLSKNYKPRSFTHAAYLSTFTNVSFVSFKPDFSLTFKLLSRPKQLEYLQDSIELHYKKMSHKVPEDSVIESYKVAFFISNDKTEVIKLPIPNVK